MKKLTTIAKAALCTSSLVFLNGCILVENQPFSPERLQQYQQEQASLIAQPGFQPLPTTPDGVMSGNAPTTRPFRSQTPRESDQPIEMSLQEIIHRTVANSLDVRVAGYQAAIDEASILEAEARFDPTIFTNVQFQRQNQQTGFGGDINPAFVLSEQYQAGIRQILPSGAQVETRYQVSRSDVNNVAFPPAENPFYTNDAIVQITQPLLRDFGSQVNRARITVARIDQKISALDWRDKLEDVLTTVEEAYWRLYEARRIVEIQEDLLRQTETMLDTLVARFRQDVRRLELTQAYATLQQRRAELVRVQYEVDTQSDRIKRLMNDPDLPVVSPKVIVPINRPLEDPVSFVLADQVGVALQNRIDLMKQKLTIDRTSTVVNAASNNLLPQLNAQASVDVQGLGGSFPDALERQTTESADQIGWAVGLAFEVPIGNRAARAIYQRTLLGRQQAIDQYRAFVEQAGLEVKEALRQVHANWHEAIARRQSRFAAEDALDAITAYEREGGQNIYTYYFVQLKLDRQTALAEARRAELDSLVTYNIALSRLERAKGTLLHYNNVVLREENGPAFYKAKYQVRK